MATFKAEAPTDVLKDVNFLERNAIDIFKGMTKAGAEVAAENIKANANRTFKNGMAAKVNAKLKVTKPYETRKHEIATGARYYGYLQTKRHDGSFSIKVKGKKYGPYPGLPASILANLAEYGTSSRAMPAQFREYWNGVKRPFIRPAFSNSAPIENAMLKAQKELSKGILE